jgi:hypothetical protein
MHLYRLIKIYPRGRIHGRIWDKSLKSFLPGYSPLLMDLLPLPPPPLQKWFETGCMETLSLRLCPEISTKLHVHEFGFSMCSGALSQVQCSPPYEHRGRRL